LLRVASAVLLIGAVYLALAGRSYASGTHTDDASWAQAGYTAALCASSAGLTLIALRGLTERPIGLPALLVAVLLPTALLPWTEFVGVAGYPITFALSSALLFVVLRALRLV
jgi:hypothetical protein